MSDSRMTPVGTPPLPAAVSNGRTQPYAHCPYLCRWPARPSAGSASYGLVRRLSAEQAADRRFLVDRSDRFSKEWGDRDLSDARLAGGGLGQWHGVGHHDL